MSDITVFYSNKIECLYQKLKKELFLKSSTPFATRLIVVPSPAIKSWLLLQMAKDSDLGIAAGVQIYYLDQSLYYLCQTFTDRDSNHIINFPSTLQLALALEIEIKKICSLGEKLDKGEQIALQPLLNYLKIDPSQYRSPLSRKSERRLVALSEKLAALFQQYGIYGGEMVEEWNTSPCKNWQEFLWKAVFSNPLWTFPQKELKSLKFKKASKNDISIHFFSLSFLSQLHSEFFNRISQYAPINYYLLSPCQVFWSDVLSDKESLRLSKYWKKNHARKEQIEKLEEFLRDRNPLLANFGKLGREMAKQIEESDVHVISEYYLPKAIKNYAEYGPISEEEIFFERLDEPLCCLKALQADMALLRNPESTPKINLKKDDRSVQIHMASTRMREVEIVYDILLGIIESHAHAVDPICPEDIIVMAPDILDYEPFIKSRFGNSESLLDFQIMDLKAPCQSLTVQGFMHLLSLPFSRWDAVSILQLFEYSAFQKRHNLSNEDLIHIRKWIKEADIRWGDDVIHRNEILQQGHCSKAMLENSGVGTWDYGFSRLLLGLATTLGNNENESDQLELLPLEIIDTTQGALLGKLIFLIKSLRKDLKLLTDNTSLTLSDWANYLQCLLEAYFFLSPAENDSSDASAIFKQIEDFKNASQQFKDQKFNFITIQKHLEKGLNHQSFCYREAHLHAVRFCSMLPMRAIPAKVIILMGMNEGAFPRPDQKFSLNLLKDNPKTNYCPSQIDYDRYLFLEALLSCRQYFIITYQGLSSSDSKPMSPSLLVSELLTYLDKAYAFEDLKASKAVFYKHPFYSFDKIYFEATSNFKSYSFDHYRSARAFYHLEKKESHKFISNFTLNDLSETKKFEKEFWIDLKQLVKIAQNPLKAYFNKTLGIYLKGKEELFKTDEDFVLSHLELSKIKKESLDKPLEQILNYAEKKGKLPLGAFKEVAIDHIKNEVEKLKKNLAAVKVSTDDIFEIEFRAHIEHPKQDERGNWQIPPLQIEYREGIIINIVGTLSPVSPHGLIAHLKDDKADVLKTWPQYLVLNCLSRQHSLPIQNQLLFAKSGKSKAAFFQDPFVLLKQYLDYYFICLESASPLIPEWIFDIINDPSEMFEKKMKESLKNDFKPIYNDYLEWLNKGEDRLPKTNEKFVQWKEKAEQLFSEIYSNWYPVKSAKKTKGIDDEEF